MRLNTVAANTLGEVETKICLLFFSLLNTAEAATRTCSKTVKLWNRSKDQKVCSGVNEIHISTIRRWLFQTGHLSWAYKKLRQGSLYSLAR